MLKWWRKKEAEPVVFGDVESAFAYACSHAKPPLLNAVIPAVVEERGGLGEQGEVYFTIRIAVPGGSRRESAPVLPGAPALPAPGDLVGYRIVRVSPELPEELGIFGYINSVLETVYVPRKGWRIARKLDPPDLKPELHL